MQCEDEWGEMRDRFKKEGLDFETLKLEDRILQVWRWLVDAEINLRNSRRMLDKLHEQQHEEIEEMENYIGKMRKLAEKRSDDLENERISLFKEKEKLESLLKSENIIGKNLLDKVAKLLEERNQVINDLEALKAFKLSADTNINNDDEMLSEIIKVSFEKESLKREVAELTDRVNLLEKSSRQLEIDNERLSFKVLVHGLMIQKVAKVIFQSALKIFMKQKVRKFHQKKPSRILFTKNHLKVMGLTQHLLPS